MTVTMVTTVDDESVLYEVYTGRAMDGDFNDGHQVWQKEVPFGMGERFRAGGAAFVAAAREQAQVAESYALMPYKPANSPAIATEPTAKAHPRYPFDVNPEGK